MKKTIAVLAALCAVTVLFCGAGYPSPTSQFYVNDYAEVLSSETENYIIKQSASLAQETGAQIVVLTVKTLDGESPAEYALHVGREWGVGDKTKNNGVLFLLCPDEGEVFISVARGLEGALNDAKVGRILDDYAMPAYKQKQFDNGTLSAYKALLSETMKEYGLEGLEGYDVKESEDSGPFSTILIVLVLLAFFFFTGGGFWGGRRHYHRRFGGWNDHNNHGGPFIGGGFGGGGFHGGGGFSGGGGTFNGGGSGRSF